MTKQEELDLQKAELINDLVATSTVMEEVWRYHPENPEKKETTEKKEDYKGYVVLPHNNRNDLTEEQLENHQKYEAGQLGLSNEMPTSNVIIEDDDDQLCFPFYPL